MKALIFILSILLFSMHCPTTISAGGDAYLLTNYRDLDLSDARFPSFSSDGSLISFTSTTKMNDGKNRTIWVANSDGTDRKLLFQSGLLKYDFLKFSPDDTKLTFSCGGLSYLVKNGTMWDNNATFTFLDIGGGPPSFSPDGEKILYGSTLGGGRGDIWIVDLEGTNSTQLTFDELGADYSDYSPEGEKIVYQRSASNGEPEIIIINSDGSGQKKIVDDSWYPTNPVFMPDGKIMFDSARISPHSRDVGAPSIWMMEQDGSNKTLLIPSRITSVGSERASINSNGTQIIFEHSFGDNFKLLVVEDPDGDGVWEDSDGDHVADICDSYPNDPDRGYYKSDDKFIPGIDYVSLSVLIAIPAVMWKRKKLLE